MEDINIQFFLLVSLLFQLERKELEFNFELWCNTENQNRKTLNKMSPREIFPLCQDLRAL